MYKDRQGGAVNKSSSFYSEQYYERARKMANMKRVLYRQRNKQLYDQEHQLDLAKIYVNRTGKCQLFRYYQQISEEYYQLKPKNIRGNQEYKDTTDQFSTTMRNKFKYFQEHMISNFYLTRDEYEQLLKEGKDPIQFKREEAEKDKKEEEDPPLLDCCNLCPVFIQQFEVNFQRTQAIIAKQSPYWDKLNGNQKLTKFKKHIEQLLKILKHQLENKCEFSASYGKTVKIKGAKKYMLNIKQARKNRRRTANKFPQGEIDLGPDCDF